MKIAILVLALVSLVHCDMYLHNPRGSNNRLDEARRDRNNGNRLFDSQNNNRGGYNVGSLYYYAGSVLSIEWTNQHSCGDQNSNCEIIFQYMCEDNVRDGASTQTIPSNAALCENYDCNTDQKYGMHESFDYYINCRLRKRNRGLFYADRGLNNRDNARFTRQNQNGNRRGYECPEERDYYPYWHPTPWRDIAILTNDPTRCVMYQAESANVKSRYACVMPETYILQNINVDGRGYRIPNTQEECEQWSWTNPATQVQEHATWTEYPPDPRLSAPECVETLWSRDNHLGNGVGGYTNLYNWTIPDLPHEHCVLRARYNISTGEYNGWDSSVNSSIIRRRVDVFNDNTNAVNNRKIISDLDVYSQFDFNTTQARARGYVFRQNPVVKIFPDPAPNSVNFGLQLAINTNQFGRTFQDRSHTFAIRSKPSNSDCTTIYNLNVRGKRGNIVQVFPGVEYDFVPNDLQVSEGSCIHIQWTGSNTNPNNNDGQGRAGTDRSNIVLLRNQTYSEGTPGMAVPTGEKKGHFGNSYPQHLRHSETFLGLSEGQRDDLAMLGTVQYGGELSELDDAGTYFDLGLAKVTGRGTYYYLCTRNNNFTNRSQKGKIIARINALFSKRVGWNGGDIQTDSATLQLARGTVMTPGVITMTTFTNESEAQAMTNNQKAPGKLVSNYVQISGFNPAEGQTGTIRLNVSDGNIDSDTKIYFAKSSEGYTFRKLDTRMENGQAVAQVDGDGVAAATNAQVALFVTVGTAVFIVLILVIAIAGVAVFFRVRRDKWNKTKEKVSSGMTNIKRSFAKKV